MIQSVGLEKMVALPQNNTPHSNTVRDLNTEQKEKAVKAATDESYIKDESQQQKNNFTSKSMIKAIEEANKNLEPSGRKLEYSIHERTNRILVKVIDIQTEEVIKEIPDEKLMDMMADLCEASGILVDEKI